MTYILIVGTTLNLLWISMRALNDANTAAMGTA